MILRNFSEIRRIWEEYGLKDRTRLETRVESIRRAKLEDNVDAGGCFVVTKLMMMVTDL